MEFLSEYRQKLSQTLAKVDMAKVEEAIGWLAAARDRQQGIFTCGNGGSASTASHFACDLVKGASHGRAKRFRVMALTDAAPTLSAYANDVGVTAVFAEQLRNFVRAGDLLVAISGSGNSANVLEAVAAARAAGCRVIGLTGRDGGKLGPAVDLNLNVPEQHMGVIEDAHLILCHMMAYWFMDCPEH
jgi:D-sedoheptulose 7-phosphate isomerase